MTIHQKINYRSYLEPDHIRNYSVYHFRMDENPLVVEPELCEIPFQINRGSQKYTQLQRYLFTR